MKKVMTVFLVIGIIVVILGIILVIIGGTLGNRNVNYTDEIFRSENAVERLELDVAAGSANVEFYEGDCVEISYQAHPKYGFTVSEKNGKVTLKPARSNWINWGWNWSKHQNPTATVYIPHNSDIDLDLSVGAGKATVLLGELNRIKVDVAAGSCILNNLTCDKIDVDVAAGTCTLEKSTCNNLKVDVAAGSCIAKDLTCDIINADVAAGSLKIDMLGDKSEYTILVDKSVGSCNVSSQQGTDVNKKIDIDVSAGSVNVNFN